MSFFPIRLNPAYIAIGMILGLVILIVTQIPNSTYPNPTGTTKSPATAGATTSADQASSSGDILPEAASTGAPYEETK